VAVNAYWDNDWYYVAGELQNNTSQTWRYPQAVVTLYDSAGTVIDSGSAYTASDSLAPGDQSPFSLNFYGPHLSQLASYAVISEAWR